MPTADPNKNAPWPGLVAAAFAILANVWMLGLDFSADDFLFLTRVPAHFVPEPWIGTDSCSGATLWYHEMIIPVPPRYIFRPTAWALWWGLVHASGGAASSVLFHGVLLLVHGLATFLLFRVLRPAVGPAAASFGALAFGIAPGSLQAVTWIAATGDTLSVVFLILSAIWLQRGRARGSLGADIVAGLCFTLAVASKESSAYFGPAVLLAGCFVPRGERPSPLWRLAVTFAAPFAALVLLRHAYTGAWGPPWNFFAIPWSGRPEIDFLAQTLAPWDAGGSAPLAARLVQDLEIPKARMVLRILGAAITLLPVLAGILCRPRWLLPRLAAVLVALAIGIIPISRYLLSEAAPLQSNGIGRAAYPIAALVAVLIAFGIHACAAAPRWICVALVVPLLLWQADFLIHVEGLEQRASDDTRLRRSSLAAIIAKSPPDTWFVAVEKAAGSPPFTDTNNGYFIEDAFQPPFVNKGVRVTWMPRGDQDVWVRMPSCFAEHEGPVQIATVDARGAYVAQDLRYSIPTATATAPEIVLRAPAPFAAFKEKMPLLEWDPMPGALGYDVAIEVRVRGGKEVPPARIRTEVPSVAFTPDLSLAWNETTLKWKEVESAILGLARGGAFPTIQVDFQVTCGSRGGQDGRSPWRTIYLEPGER